MGYTSNGLDLEGMGWSKIIFELSSIPPVIWSSNLEGVGLGLYITASRWSGLGLYLGRSGLFLYPTGSGEDGLDLYMTASNLYLGGSRKN